MISEGHEKRGRRYSNNAMMPFEATVFMENIQSNSGTGETGDGPV